MKKILFLLLSYFFFTNAFAQQTNNNQPVYLRFPTVPSFTIFKAPDSSTYTRDYLKKKKQVMFFIFSPECGHCKSETEMMIRNMDKLKDVQIVMVTYLPYSEMLEFYNHYKLNRFSNIIVGRDPNFFFPTYFQVRNFPSFYIYDKNWSFKKFLEGDVKINTLTDALKL